PVRKENVFSKGGFVAAHQGVHRHAGKLCQLLELTLGENKAVERGCRLDDFQPELSGEIVTKCGGTGLRDGQPARSNHKRVASVVSLVSVEYETLVFAYATNAALQSKLGSGLTAFAYEHVDDLLGGVIAKELSKLLFVKGDLVLLNESDEIIGRVARQC